MDEALRLATAFAERGTEIQPRAARPLLLEGDGHAWHVHTGAADVFLCRVEAGRPVGALHPLGRRSVGQTLWGLPPQRTRRDWGLVALATAGSRLHGLPWPELCAVGAPVADATWLAAALTEWTLFLQQPLRALAPEGLPLPGLGQRVSGADGDILVGAAQSTWVRVLSGSWHYLGAPEMALDGGLLPVGRGAWLACQQAGELEVVDPARLPDPAALPGEFARLQDGLWSALLQQRQAHEQQGAERLRRKQGREATRLGDAFAQLTGALGGADAAPVGEPAGGDALFAACRRLGHAAGISFQLPAAALAEQPGHDRLAEIAEASRVRRRRVALQGRWWREVSVPMLGFRKSDGAPVVLLPSRRGCLLQPPEGGAALVVDEARAAELDGFAWTFYRGLGAAAPGVLGLLRFGSRGVLGDYLMVVAMGVAIGLIGLATPLATGVLFDSVIPGAERDQLLQLGLALLAAAFGSSLFEAARGFAALRAEGRLDLAVQAAIWDRLVRLPATFFRGHSAGDLAVRANGIDTILRIVSGGTLTTLMSAVFSSFNLLLLFYYHAGLALLALLLVAFAVAVTVSLGLVRLRHERHLAAAEGRISGQVLQLLGGIARLRAFGAEARAFHAWATNYGQQQAHAFRARIAGGVLDVFNSAFPTLANMLLFGAIALYLSDERSFGTGQFMAFNAAFGALLSAMLSATTTLMGILNVVPIYERARPILETTPEITEARAHPGALRGDIEVSHVSFAYGTDSPLVLSDLDLRIRAGEFVAIVGASGSGKSTLLRILLGFEQPTQGLVYYDRQNLAELDPGAVRRQLGVVLQNGQLMSGDIFGNIVGSSPLTLDDAWLAAERAGIADDIRAMPMGMHTVVSEGGSTLSGGQRQRLMIARAIVHRPRILFFDEATSALDNQTQALVSRSLAEMNVTRIVIAHRLSTIVHADRILVMDGGRIVQSGSYEELLGSEGLFAELARRQTL